MAGVVERVRGSFIALALVAGVSAFSSAWTQSASADEPVDAGPFGPIAGYTFDPLSMHDPDDVPQMEQPDWWTSPVFRAYFGSGLRPAGAGIESVAVGASPAGDPRVFVSTAKTNRVYAYDGVLPGQPIGSFGAGAGPGGLSDAAGVAYARGEVFVVDRRRAQPESARVVVYDGAGAYKRSFPLLNPAGIADMTGIDVAAGEVWVTGEFCGGLGGVVEIFDALTGAIKGITLNAAHAPTGDPAHPCDAAWDASSWWDLATVPELDAAVAQYRLVQRGAIAALTTPDPEPGCYTCFRRLWQDGIDAVWGMRWLLAVDGDSRTSRGTGVTEYSFEPAAVSGHPFLQERRRWTPRQSGTGGVRDVAYFNRETRIDWDGPLATNVWLRATKCVNYVVSDADIYAVGDQGEHWYEQARAFQSIALWIDGQLKQTSTSPVGQFCIDTRQYANRPGPGEQPHALELRATLEGNRVVTITNPDLRIDNLAPTGTVASPGPYVRGTTVVTGTAVDPHSGPASWQLEAQGSGGAWQTVCAPDTEPDVTGAFACSWNTTADQYPDGNYNLRARLIDRSSDGGNASYTPEVSTIVDNTDPTMSLSGDLKDADDFYPLEPEQTMSVHVDAQDGTGSGIRALELSVDGTVRDSAAQSCSGGGCPMARDLSISTSDYADGEHTVSVAVQDQAGRTTSQSWQIDVEIDVPEPAEEEATEAAMSTSSAAMGGLAVDLSYPLGLNTDPPTTEDLLGCTAADEPLNFRAYSLGSSFEGLPLTAVLRRCDLVQPPEPVRANFASYIYGTCDAEVDNPDVEGDEDPGGCAPPLEIQSWPVCERNLASYTGGPDMEPPAFTPLEIRGVPAAGFEGGDELELYAGATTIVIFGSDPAQVLRAANLLQEVPPDQPPVLAQRTSFDVGPSADLPEPVDGALNGKVSCLDSVLEAP